MQPIRVQVFDCSRTVSPEKAEAAPLAAPQLSAAQNIIVIEKYLVFYAINSRVEAQDGATQIAYEANAMCSAVAYDMWRRYARYNEITLTVRSGSPDVVT